MYFKVLFMHQEEQHTSLETLQEIRSIMDRSAKFLTLSGWSGIWAGLTALAGAWVANGWIQNGMRYYDRTGTSQQNSLDDITIQFIVLAAIVFIIALAGALFFTYRKTRKSGQKIWNSASRQLLLYGSIPLLAGGVCAIAFIYHGHEIYIGPSCLIFYGLALINGSKYTLSDIRYLGLLELILGCICLFYPGYGLYFWAAGFGVLHILYGIIMWNKYDKVVAR